MKFTHFMMIPFTGLGLHNGFRGNVWLKNRLAIFEQYVVPSLAYQTSQNFKMWFCWRKEEESNPLVVEFRKRMGGIHTFSGIPFWDDKYEDAIASQRLMSTLKDSLPLLEKYVEHERVLLTIQPSDDMYVSDTVQRLQTAFGVFKSTKQAVGYRRGYIMNYQTKEIAEYMSEPWKADDVSTYHTDTIPPFFTILYSKEEFLNPEKHYRHIGPYKSHEYVADYLEYTALEGRGFIVGCHGENISTTYNHRYKGRVLSEDEAQVLMESMGIQFAEPARFKISSRHRFRKLLNLLPFRSVLKYVYYQLPARWRII